MAAHVTTTAPLPGGYLWTCICGAKSGRVHSTERRAARAGLGHEKRAVKRDAIPRQRSAPRRGWPTK